MDELPRIIGFRLATDDPNEPIWMPRQPHAWKGEREGHTYHAACAICRFGEFPEARDAVLAAMNQVAR